MKKVFIDTNVIIDLLLKREGYETAARILSLGKEAKYSLYVSVLTMANIAYILRKVLRGKQLYDALRKLSSIITVLSITDKDYEAALQLEATDFEDALQYFCACAYGCEIIVTRNEKDFTFSNLMVVSPDNFIE